MLIHNTLARIQNQEIYEVTKQSHNQKPLAKYIQNKIIYYIFTSQVPKYENYIHKSSPKQYHRQ